jgi:hypothetical protein
MQRIAAVLALALSTLLSGCFVSEKPVFAPSSAVRPLEAGRYALFEQLGDKEKPSEYMDVRLRADGGYDWVNEKGAAVPVSLHAIGGGLHVAQVRETDEAKAKKQAWGYALLKVNGREALVYVLECDKQDKAKLRALGVELRGKYECFIDKVKNPAAFFAGLKRGKTASRMLRE